MKVLVATPWLAPQGGGLERYAATIARELAAAGDEVLLIGHASAAADGAEGVRVIAAAPRWRLSNTPLSVAIAREAKRLLRAEAPDLVNVHTPVPGVAELVAWQARRAGVPYVVTYHAGRLAGPAGILQLAAQAHRATGERWMLRRAASRVAVSPYVARHVLGDDAEIIPPGVDTSRFRPTAAIAPGRILFVGPIDRAYEWKGLAVLARAFELLAPHEPRAHLRLVGRGDLEARYAAQMAQRGLAERFSIAGRVDDDALVREYSEANVVVLPSTSDAESFGMVLAEANACERPVIGSDIGGIPGFVRPHENGLLVPPGDPVALAEAILEILGDDAEARRIGARGRTRVTREHGWRELAGRTRGVFQRCLDGAPSRPRREPRWSPI